MATETSPLKKTTCTESYDSCEVRKRNTSLGSLDRAIVGSRFCGIRIPPGFWWIMLWGLLSSSSAIVLVLVHKYMFQKYKFPFLVGQMVEMVAQILIASLLGIIFDRGNKPISEIVWPRFRIDFWTFMRLLPVGVLYVLRIRTSNGAVAANPVSTYQCLRSAAIIFTVLLSWLCLGMRPSIGVLLSCLVIFLGVAVPNLDTSAIPPVGLAWGMAAAVFTALYFVAIKYYLPVVDNDSRVLTHYNSLSSIVMLLPLALYMGEFPIAARYIGIGPPPEMREAAPLSIVWSVIACACLGAFSANICSMNLVKCSSPVTYDVFSFVKSIVQGYVGYMFLHESRSAASLIGNAFAIGGTFMYGKAKHMEHQAQVRALAEGKKRACQEKRKSKST